MTFTVICRTKTTKTNNPPQPSFRIHPPMNTTQPTNPTTNIMNTTTTTTTQPTPATRAVWALIDPANSGHLPESAQAIADKISANHPWRLELENLWRSGDVDDPSPERQGANIELRDLINRMVDETCTWQSKFCPSFIPKPQAPPTRSAQIAEHAQTLGPLVAPYKVDRSAVNVARLEYARALVDWYTLESVITHPYEGDEVPEKYKTSARALAWMGFFCERNKIGVDSTYRHPMFALGSGRRLANDGPCYDRVIELTEQGYDYFSHGPEDDNWGRLPTIRFSLRPHTILCGDRADITIEMPVLIVSGGSFESPVEISIHELICWAPPAFLVKMLAHDEITKNVTPEQSIAYRKLFWFAYGANLGYQIALFVAASEHEAE